eukprot:scaffold62280_cov22-Tisochrysis_lutea.AAC.1
MLQGPHPLHTSQTLLQGSQHPPVGEGRTSHQHLSHPSLLILTAWCKLSRGATHATHKQQQRPHKQHRTTAPLTPLSSHLGGLVGAQPVPATHAVHRQQQGLHKQHPIPAPLTPMFPHLEGLVKAQLGGKYTVIGPVQGQRRAPLSVGLDKHP